jgi:hypothetical protein
MAARLPSSATQTLVLVRNHLCCLRDTLLRTRATSITPCARQTNALSNLRIIPPQCPLFRMRYRIQFDLHPRTYALESRTLALRGVRAVVA